MELVHFHVANKAYNYLPDTLKVAVEFSTEANRSTWYGS